MLRASAWVLGLALLTANGACTETLRLERTRLNEEEEASQPAKESPPPKKEEMMIEGAAGAVLLPRPPATVVETGTVMTAITALRMDPPQAALDISEDEGAKQKFSVYAVMDDRDDEIDVTDSAVFYVSDHPELGSCPDNGPEFATNTDRPRGGYARVTARVSNVDGEVLEVTAGVTLKLAATLKDPREDGALSADLPEDPEKLFESDENTERQPRLVYPNDGVLLPPNMNQLDVHFRPGDENTVFEIKFDSAVADLRYFVRCGPLTAGGCIFALNGQGYRLLADSNRGAPPVTVRIRATNDAGEWVAVGEPIHIQFTDTDVNGGLYYWTTSGDSAIMRFDFGVEGSRPEVFLAPNQDGMGSRCIGCHAISPDGRKAVASLSGQWQGYQVFVDDLTQPRSDADFIDRTGQAPADKDEDPIQFAAFNPDGSQFVSVYGDIDPAEARNVLWFHDGDTGVRIPSAEVRLDFEPDHPTWSADGELIAMSRVGYHNTSQRPLNCGISIIERQDDMTWGQPWDVVPIVEGDGKSRYNPAFVPDSSLLIFSESTCPDGDERSLECDGDADPSAKTWAVEPKEGAVPVYLENASAPGVLDADQRDLTDTFPRTSPFEGYYRDPTETLDSELPLRQVYWVTIASRRRVGLKNEEGNQQLWMFAVDPHNVLDGEDGSFPGFHLPFQDESTRNHIAQWTQFIVDDTPPPEVPEPPPPDVPEPPELD